MVRPLVGEETHAPSSGGHRSPWTQGVRCRTSPPLTAARTVTACSDGLPVVPRSKWIPNILMLPPDQHGQLPKPRAFFSSVDGLLGESYFFTICIVVRHHGNSLY